MPDKKVEHGSGDGPISDALDAIFEGDGKKLEGAARTLGDSSTQAGAEMGQISERHIKRLRKEQKTDSLKEE